MKQCTINFSKLSSFKLMSLSDCTFLHIEDDPYTSHEVTGAYLSEEIWRKVSLCLILLQFPNVLLLSFLSTFWPFSRSPYSVSVCLSLSFISFIRGNINKMHYYANKCNICIKARKLHNMQYKSLNICY